MHFWGFLGVARGPATLHQASARTSQSNPKQSTSWPKRGSGHPRERHRDFAAFGQGFKDARGLRDALGIGPHPRKSVAYVLRGPWLTKPCVCARSDSEIHPIETGDFSMPESHKEILQKANAAIMQGDYEGFLKFCTEDTEWTFVGDRTLKGKDAVREWMASEYKEPPRFEVHQMIAEGDFVASLGEITLKDDTGKDTRHAYCDVWRFRGGRMAGLQAFVVEAGVEGGALP